MSLCSNTSVTRAHLGSYEKLIKYEKHSILSRTLKNKCVQNVIDLYKNQLAYLKIKYFEVTINAYRELLVHLCTQYFWYIHCHHLGTFYH